MVGPNKIRCYIIPDVSLTGTNTQAFMKCCELATRALSCIVQAHVVNVIKLFLPLMLVDCSCCVSAKRVFTVSLMFENKRRPTEVKHLSHVFSWPYF
jgi:hypothetical protein